MNLREHMAAGREVGLSGPVVALLGLWPFALGIVLAVIAQKWVSPRLDPYDAGLVMNVGVNIILAVSLTIVNGFTGQFSMGHAGFLAVGGYAAGATSYYGSIAIFGDAETHGGWLSEHSLGAGEVTSMLASGDLLFVGSVIVGGLVAAGMGYLVGLPSLRLRGDYLAIVTLGFGEIVRVLVQQTGRVLRPYTLEKAGHALDGHLVYDITARGADGRTTTIQQAVADTPFWEVMTRLGGSLGFSQTPKYTSLFWIVLAVSVMLVVAYRLKQSTQGRAFLSIREDEIAAEAMGVGTTRYKVRAFVVAAFFAGIAGGLYAHFKSMNPNEVGFSRSFDFVIMVVLGGLGSISGAVIAAVLVSLLPEYLRFLADYRMMIWSLALVLMMIFRPSGLLGVREVWELWGRRPRMGKGAPP